MSSQVQYSSSTPYELVFKAKRGGKENGFIGVDDIKVIEGSCEQPITPPPPTPTRKDLNLKSHHGFFL